MSKADNYTKCITDKSKCDKVESCLRRNGKRGEADYIAIHNDKVYSWYIEEKKEVEEIKDGEESDSNSM